MFDNIKCLSVEKFVYLISCICVFLERCVYLMFVFKVTPRTSLCLPLSNLPVISSHKVHFSIAPLLLIYPVLSFVPCFLVSGLATPVVMLEASVIEHAHTTSFTIINNISPEFLCLSSSFTFNCSLEDYLTDIIMMCYMSKPGKLLRVTTDSSGSCWSVCEFIVS